MMQSVTRELKRQESSDSAGLEVRTALGELTAPSTITFSTSTYRDMQKPFVPQVHVLFFCDYSSEEGDACLEVMYSTAPRYRGR